jgi:hypothetical protein
MILAHAVPVGRAPAPGEREGAELTAKTSQTEDTMTDERRACEMLAFGLATFMVDHDPRSLELISRAFDGHPTGLT